MKMIFILIGCFLTLNVYSQEFEGYILYKYQYLDSLGNDITDQYGPERGYEQNYFINSKNYKGIDEKGRLSQLYNQETNTFYFQVGTEIKKFSGSTDYPKEFKYEEINDSMDILGYKCKAIIVTNESGQTIYYFNEIIAINADEFKGHRFGNWYNVLVASHGSIPLKFIVKKKNYTLIAVAVKIEKMELNDDEFNLEKILGIHK